MATELRYCEKCGEIIQQTPDSSVDLTDRFICKNCDGDQVSRPSDAPAGRPIALEDLPESADLELFSQATIAMQKKEIKSPPPERPLKLQDSRENGETQNKKNPEQASPAASASPASPQAAEANAPLQLVSNSANTGAAAPAATAKKIVFRCLHCRVTLAIRPVKNASRLTCPYCSKMIYVTANGQLLKNPPSVVFREGSGAVYKIGPESVSVDKEPSSWNLQRDVESGTQALSAIVEKVADMGQPTPPPDAAGRQGSSVVQRKAGPGTPGTPGSAAIRQGSAAVKKPGSVAIRQGSGAVRKPGSAAIRHDSAAVRKPESAAVRKPGSDAIRRGSGAVPKPGSVAIPKQEAGSPGAQLRLSDVESLALDRPQGSGATTLRTRVGPPPQSLLARIFRRTVGGIVITLSLTLPIVLLAGIHHMVSQHGEHGADNVSSAQNTPTAFEELGEIAQAGMKQLKALLGRD